MKNLTIVAKYTFLEVYRSKLMISLVMLALGLVVISLVASEFTYGAPGKIALDVGFGIMSLSNLVIAIFIGTTLLSREIDQRTIYMIISRPISRSSFLFGKILGLSAFLLINTFLLGFLSIFLYLYYNGSFNDLFVWTIYFSFIEAFIVLIFAVLFSLLTNTTLSVLFSMCIFITGHALNETSKIVFTKISPLLSTTVKISSMILPNLYRLNLKDYVIYNQSIPLKYLLNTQVYSCFYIFSLSAIVILIFKQKNLD